MSCHLHAKLSLDMVKIVKTPKTKILIILIPFESTFYSEQRGIMNTVCSFRLPCGTTHGYSSYSGITFVNK